MGEKTTEDDFTSLLGHHNRKATSTQEQSFNLDHLTRERQNLSPKRQSSQNGSDSNGTTKGGRTPKYFSIGYGEDDGLLSRLSAYVSMLCYFYPGICGTLVFMVIGLVLFGLGTLIFNPRVEYGVMKHDHSFLESMYNAKAGDIDHWCLRGDNNSCRCEDPLIPSSRADRKSWRLAFKTNYKIASKLKESGIPLDLVFLGESVVEEMDGRWMGQGRSPALEQMAQLFQKRFVRAKRSDVEGKGDTKDSSDNGENASEGNGASGRLNAAALGIAGDTAPNILWRLMHGEMQVEPKIWWLSLGMNDLSRMQCSEEVVVLGILRIVEKIQREQPDAHIVINSLFPMSRIRGNIYPSRTDYQDSLVSSAVTHVRHPRNSDQGGERQLQKDPSSSLSSEDSVRRSLFGRQKPSATNEPERPMTAEEKEADDEDAQYEKEGRKRFGFFGFGNREPSPLKNVDPVLVESHRVRKHIQDFKLPLWTSVLTINRDLKSFADETEGVTFFDATPLFTRPSNDGSHHMILKTELISIMGHPTWKGFDIWEEAVAMQAMDILKKMKDEKPWLFPKSNDNSGGNKNNKNVDDYVGGWTDDGTPYMGNVIDWGHMADEEDSFNDDWFNHAGGSNDDWPDPPQGSSDTDDY
ncbi:hypothetical protein ACA910_003015 [Epithemia clementina (nom. ined.)]